MGRLVWVDGYDVPPVDEKGKGGCPPGELVDLEPGERIVAILEPAAITAGVPACLVTASGVIKRIAAEQLDPRSFSSVISLKDDDRVVAAFCAVDDADVVVVSSDARLLRTPLGKVRPQGRSAAGVAGMRINDGARVLAAGPAHSGQVVVHTLSDASLAKSCAVVEYPQKGRGTAGVGERRLRRNESSLIAAHVTDRTVSAVGAGGGPVAMPEPGSRNDPGSPTAKPASSLALVAR
jgi:DNA gyrase subunit A